MEEKAISEIKKIQYFREKIERIQNYIEKEEYEKAYNAVAKLIEILCIIILEKIYNEKVENSNIIIMAEMLRKKEPKIENILIEINGNYNYINLEKVEKYNVIALILDFNELLQIVLGKHGNIFD